MSVGGFGQAKMVMCTGCGDSIRESEAMYSDHADTYSGTVWHCPRCWDVCSAEQEESR